MIIETLILSSFAFIAGAVIGYFYAKKNKTNLLLKKHGWHIDCWDSKQTGRYFISVQTDKKLAIMTVGPDESIDFIYKKDKNNDE